MSIKHVRMSRRNHPMPIEDNPQKKGRYTGAPRVGEVLKAPVKSDAHFRKMKTTPPPISDEQPSRGEGPERNFRQHGNK